MKSSRAGTPTYVHGTSRDEQRRLTDMNTVIKTGCLGEPARLDGERVLDVAGVLGQLTREIARAVGPTGTVIGVERDAAQLAEARKQAASQGEADLVEFREGDAFDLPLSKSEWGSFDLVHTRFLLEKVSDPLVVVKQMAAAAKPGGRIVVANGKLIILDEDGQLALTTATADDLTIHSRCNLELHDAWATPTLIGRTLFIRDRDNIMALDLG